MEQDDGIDVYELMVVKVGALSSNRAITTIANSNFHNELLVLDNNADVIHLSLCTKKDNVMLNLG